MRSADVTFRKVEAPVQTLGDANDDDKREMDVIEIRYPDGKVAAFPADHKSPETGVRYRDMFPAKYKAFKNGEPDADRVAQLEREIKERQDELNAMRGEKGPDDERVQENLGYGKMEPDPDPHSTDQSEPLTLGTPEHEPHRIDQPVTLGPDADSESRPKVEAGEPAKERA